MMKIGDVSTKLGLPASTIRYYEKVGLIEHQRRVSGRREFDNKALLALQFVGLSQAAGFTIAETKILLDSYKAGPNANDDWKTHATNKQEEVRNQIKKLIQMDEILTAMLSCDCQTLSECVEKSLSNDASN